MPSEKEKKARRERLAHEALMQAASLDGRERTFYDHVDRAGSKGFTGYPLLPTTFAPTNANHPARKQDSDAAYNLADAANNYANSAYILANSANNTANTAYSYAVPDHHHASGYGDGVYTSPRIYI